MAQKDRFYSPSDIDMLRLRMIPIRIDFHSPSGGMRNPYGEKTRLSFSAFPYVCPEPALAKRSVRYEHGSKQGVFENRTKKRMLSCLGWTGLPSGVSSGASELQRDPKTLHGKNVRKKDLEGTQRKHRTHESRTSHTHTASTQPLWPASCYLGLVRSHTLSLSIYT